MIRINQLKLTVGNENLKAKIIKKLKLKRGCDFSYEIVKRSVDARKKPQIFYSYVVDVRLDFGIEDEIKQVMLEKEMIYKLADSDVVFFQTIEYHFPYQADEKKPTTRPIIIGTGPAGLFCGYMLAKAGFKPILLERGEAVEDRAKTVERFFTEGILDTESNVQFGEGGAGTFSDGKLNTQVKDKDGIKKAVLSILVEAGAPPEILYEQKPHLGTDKLRKIVAEMRKQIMEYGGEVRFGQKVTGFRYGESEIGDRKITSVIINNESELPGEQIVLAIGHSARDSFTFLYNDGIKMEAKPFAVGFRVEHPQELINLAQYGVNVHEILGAADYKLVSKSCEPIAYSFCMCPGGYIVDASSEEGRLTINGMSYSDRAGDKANSAIVMPVLPDELDSDHPLWGIEYQREIEEKAYQLGQGKIPVQLLGDFKNEQTNDARLNPCIKGSCRYAPVHEILDDKRNQAFLKAMKEFGRQIPGFDDKNTIIAGIESRTSSPVRILRDRSMQANVRGLYPCGEGAGYAGGIMSAAIDGVRVAEAVAKTR